MVFLLQLPRPPISTPSDPLVPYTTLFRSMQDGKNPEIRVVAKIGTAFAMLPASVRDTARSQRERRKDAERNHQSLPPPRHLLRDLRGRGPGLRLQPAVAPPRVHRAALLLPRADLHGLFPARRRRARRDRKSTRLNSSHYCASRMPSLA